MKTNKLNFCTSLLLFFMMANIYGQAYGDIDITASGTSIDLTDETGERYTFLEPDAAGDGGFFALYDASYIDGFFVDGNAISGKLRVSMQGTSSMFFNTSSTGDESVDLPVDAISSNEVLDEPGVANALSSTATLTSTTSSLVSRSITVPDTGFVMVLATCELNISHTNGQASGVEIGVSTDGSSFPPNADIQVSVPDNSATGDFNFPATAQAIFEVLPGTHTFHFNGREIAGTATTNDINLSLLYVPTAYGTVTSNIGGSEEQSRSSVNPLSVTEKMDAERAQSILDNQARIDKEIREMKATIAALRNENQNKN